MDHPQLEEASLPATVKPIWVPSTTPFTVDLSAAELMKTYSILGLKFPFPKTVCNWEGGWTRKDYDLLEECSRVRFDGGSEPPRSGRPLNPFRTAEREELNPWASRLGRQSIRLFALELDDRDTITGTLISFERSKSPRYAALSYVCGQGSCDQEITVNDGCLCVKPNLLAALKLFKSCMIRKIWGDKTLIIPGQDKFCWVWVDAMSINQDDAIEKAEQIGEMHHVYREAKRVVACLGHFGSDFECVARILRWAEGVRYPTGPDRRRRTQLELVEQLRGFDVSPSNLRAIFDKMKFDLESHLGHLIDEKLIDRISKDEILGFEEGSVVAIPMRNDHPFVNTMLESLEHEWFSRLWTYQEYYLAVRVGEPSSLEFVLEDHAISWNTLMDCQSVAVNIDQSHNQESTSLLKRRVEIIRRRNIESPFRQRSGGFASLWALLETSCQRRATVAGDHVFAILGLMEPEIRSHILIDYSRSAASIFTDAFELAINHEGDGLRLTRCWERLALIPSITPGLPSWCPDLANDTQLSIGRLVWKTLSDRIPSSYDKFVDVRVSPSDRSLHLRVMRADVVTHVVGTPCPSIGPFPENFYQSHLDWQSRFAGLLGTWLLKLSSTLGSTDGQEDYLTFERGLDALLWQCLSPGFGFLRQTVMDTFFPECSELDHECIIRRHLTDPRWCFKKFLAYIRLVKCLFGKTSHHQHQRLGADYHEECTVCILSRDPKVLSSAHRCGVHLDRVSIDPGSSKCISLHDSGEERLLIALLHIVGALGYQLHGTYIFKTAAGRYGHSARCPSVGDHVCVVPGGELVHIISADKSRYVGVASADGLMDDDILEQDLFPDPEGRFEEVVLH